MKLYIAGPMRGYPRFNFDAFDVARDHLRSLGHSVVSPADLDREHGFDPVRDAHKVDEAMVEEMLERDFEAMDRCEAVVVLPGWERSNGTARELAHAAKRELPVFRYPDMERIDIGDGEVRTVCAATGGEKGQKLARFDLLPPGPIWKLAEHFGRGALKYDARNWERGYEWSKSFSALMRHAWAFWAGEDIDPETGTPHVIAVAWHALVLSEFMESHPSLDDRPLQGVTDGSSDTDVWEIEEPDDDFDDLACTQLQEALSDV